MAHVHTTLAEPRDCCASGLPLVSYHHQLQVQLPRGCSEAQEVKIAPTDSHARPTQWKQVSSHRSFVVQPLVSSSLGAMCAEFLVKTNYKYTEVWGRIVPPAGFLDQFGSLLSTGAVRMGATPTDRWRLALPRPRPRGQKQVLAMQRSASLPQGLGNASAVAGPSAGDRRDAKKLKRTQTVLLQEESAGFS